MSVDEPVNYVEEAADPEELESLAPLASLFRNAVHGHSRQSNEGFAQDLWQQVLAKASAEQAERADLVSVEDSFEEDFLVSEFGKRIFAPLPGDKSKASTEPLPDSSTYPFRSKEDFITSLLFSSPRMPFSAAQKSAVLSWAKELGAPHVPSLYSINKLQDFLAELVGNPTQWKTTKSGDIFYLNNVAEAIAKATPQQLADYPEDTGERTSGVFNGEKLLLEAPSPPAVQVLGTVFFINELLRDSMDSYFIPERFFYALYPLDDQDDKPERQLGGHAAGPVHPAEAKPPRGDHTKSAFLAAAQPPGITSHGLHARLDDVCLMGIFTFLKSCWSRGR
ncbi:hypothetical protein CONPUDRAFT_155099 [Coniophora puteana RWD-64-598 SS2]|uniref:Uncharacterized protein n=1 Tax=Coniophora puteana (strain RWD-64-598) TaxID=741705 RepID=A0A5M3MLN8_CONPW|nr:uncharacterized protein CONPUDRAFT_155099 [Coniophora puteana RWD-64-598 SS2]EIW79704.1 hypothetical protein CONPUDRAFT_155099 [Coniophora puteana RWD-64-598 SS2]